MISKEKLLNGYIENDQEKLKKLWIGAALRAGVDFTWMSPERITGMMNLKYCYIDNQLPCGSNHNPDIFGKNKLTLEDFVDEGVTQQPEIKIENCTFTSNDIFQRMLMLSEQHNVLIQFDGLAEEAVVTCQDSDKEYTVTNKQDFDSLINSIKTLSKFERS